MIVDCLSTCPVGGCGEKTGVPCSWPSGPRRHLEVVVSSEAWVRTPPNTIIFSLSLFLSLSFTRISPCPRTLQQPRPAHPRSLVFFKSPSRPPSTTHSVVAEGQLRFSLARLFESGTRRGDVRREGSKEAKHARVFAQFFCVVLFSFCGSSEDDNGHARRACVTLQHCSVCCTLFFPLSLSSFFTSILFCPLSLHTAHFASVCVVPVHNMRKGNEETT